jgi:hypothetical protein
VKKERDFKTVNHFSTEQELGEYTVQLYRAWHELEKSGPVDVIDFDLINQDFPSIGLNSRQDVLDRFSAIRLHSVESPAQEFLCAKLLASKSYLKSLEGEYIPFREYCEQTVGIVPEMFSEEGLIQQRNQADEALDKLGYKPTPEGYKNYFPENILQTDEIQRQFNKAKEKSNEIIARALGLQHLLPMDYKESIVSEDAYWICFISGQKTGMDFKINVHPRNRIRWVKGTPETISAHEMGGHLMQALSWRENIRNGLINPLYGVTSIPGPEQWACEGMADALPALIPELYAGFSNEAKFMHQLKVLSSMVKNNTHIMANDGQELSTIKDYTNKYHPFETIERIEKGFKDATESPYLRAYLMTYNDGMPYFNNLGKDLGIKSLQLLKELYKRPMTPTQVKKFVETLH